MKRKPTIEDNKLNLILCAVLIVSVGFGCKGLLGGSLENTTWKGAITDPQSGRSFPVSVDLLPDDKAYISITLPNAAQPMIGSAKWSKKEKKVTATWGSGETTNNFEGKVNDDQINGTVTNPKGSMPVTLTREKD